MRRYELRDELMFTQRPRDDHLSFSTSPPPFFKINNSCTLSYYLSYTVPLPGGPAAPRGEALDESRERERTTTALRGGCGCFVLSLHSFVRGDRSVSFSHLVRAPDATHPPKPRVQPCAQPRRPLAQPCDRRKPIARAAPRAAQHARDPAAGQADGGRPPLQRRQHRAVEVRAKGACEVAHLPGGGREARRLLRREAEGGRRAGPRGG